MSIKNLGGVFGRNPTFNDVDVNRLSLEVTQSGPEVVIASGAVTITSSYARVDTEGDASTDDLDTINGGVFGQMLIIRAASSSRTVVCKDGTGNLELAGDFSLTHNRDVLVLLCIAESGSYRWIELTRSDNAT